MTTCTDVECRIYPAVSTHTPGCRLCQSRYITRQPLGVKAVANQSGSPTQANSPQKWLQCVTSRITGAVRIWLVLLLDEGYRTSCVTWIPQCGRHRVCRHTDRLRVHHRVIFHATGTIRPRVPYLPLRAISESPATTGARGLQYGLEKQQPTLPLVQDMPIPLSTCGFAQWMQPTVWFLCYTCTRVRAKVLHILGLARVSRI